MEDFAAAFETVLAGRSCRVQRDEIDWVFDFQDQIGVRAACHWRLVSAERIVLTDEDDGQQFGLPKPVDAEVVANERLAGVEITSATLDRVTADLCLRFSNGLRLDLLNNSAGYEGWQGGFSYKGAGVTIIALGGGGFAVF